MKRIIILLTLAVFMGGCVREKPAYEQTTQNALDTITAIEQGLSPECHTDTNKLLFNVSRKEVSRIKTDCDAAVAKIRQEKTKWQWSFMGLALVVLVYIIKRVLR